MMIRRFFNWLFGLLGYAPRVDLDRERNVMTRELDEYKRRCDLLGQRAQVIASVLDTVNAQLEEHKKLAEYLKYDTMESLKIENERVLKMAQECEDHCKRVETEVSKIMHSDEVFRFSGKPAIPGATVVQMRPLLGLSTEEDGNSLAIIGRTVLTDDATREIHGYVSFSEKYSYLIRYLYQQSITQRIVDNILSSGAVQFTLGYNEDTTTVEAYYKIICALPDPSSVVQIVKTENNTGEGA